MASVQKVEFRSITHGFDHITNNLTMPRHRHLRAYASVIVSGAVEESSYAGRLCARAGDVLVHPALDAHQNHEITSTVDLFRLYWPDHLDGGGMFRLHDLDELVRVAEKDVYAASDLLMEVLKQKPPTSPGKRNDWPDMLAQELADDPTIFLGEWANTHGLAAETVSRGFSKAYGIAPEFFRAELKTKAAWLRIKRTSDRLGAIAAETGFADQSHMTRWVRRLTGLPPMAWR